MKATLSKMNGRMSPIVHYGPGGAHWVDESESMTRTDDCLDLATEYLPDYQGWLSPLLEK